MNIDICTHDKVHLLGESATHPIEPRCGTLAALLLIAGMGHTSDSLATLRARGRRVN